MNEEIYKPIEGFEDYQISNHGNVKSTLGRFKKRKEFIMKSDEGRMGHQRVLLSKPIRIKKFVQRLVAEAFIENVDNKPQINHIDNNPRNNNVENLEWCTGSENLIHAQKQGRLFEAQLKGGKANGKLRHDKAIQNAMEIVGEKFNKWTVLEFAEMKHINEKHTRAYLLCECECGLQKELDIHYLKKRANQCSECSYKARKKHKVKM